MTSVRTDRSVWVGVRKALQSRDSSTGGTKHLQAKSTPRGLDDKTRGRSRRVEWRRRRIRNQLLLPWAIKSLNVYDFIGIGTLLLPGL